MSDHRFGYRKAGAVLALTGESDHNGQSGILVNTTPKAIHDIYSHQ